MQDYEKLGVFYLGRKACANFWVEDRGREVRAILALACDAPDVVPLRRPSRVCLTLKNTGDDIEPLAIVTCRFPPGRLSSARQVRGKWWTEV